MSQIPPQKCPQCGTFIEAGQRFCPNCGSAAPQPMDPTVASSGVASSFNNMSYGNAPSNPGYNAYPPSPSNPSYPGYSNASSVPSNPNLSNSAYPGMTPPPPSQSGAFTQYNSGTVPPPAPVDPYSSPKPFYTATQERKKRSALTPIIIALVVIVLAAAGTGIFFLSRNSSPNKGSTGGGGGNNGTSTYAASQPIDLTVTYSSDQITFNKIEQAAKFADDTQTSYSFNNIKDYIRVDFNEKQTATQSSYFSYFESFHIKLPTGSTVQAQKSEEDSGPESGVQRPNWVDFPAASGQVDLSKLTLIVGTSSEAQITFPLKTGADLSQYQPKTFAVSSTFPYAGMSMTIKAATRSYYYNGQQAKAGKVFITIDLSADNKQDSEIYLDSTNLLRLKTSAETVSPEDYGTGLNNFDIINPQTTGITGTGVFQVTPSPDGKYTVVFQSGTNITEVDQQIQLS